MTTPTTAELVERVRANIASWRETFSGTPEMREAVEDVVACFEALFPVVTTLADRVEELERENAERYQAGYWPTRTRRAEAEVARLRRIFEWLAKDEAWATAHPDGAFGLPPNTWGPAPDWVQTMARAALSEEPRKPDAPPENPSHRGAPGRRRWQRLLDGDWRSEEPRT